jgi:hypothetical protein
MSSGLNIILLLTAPMTSIKIASRISIAENTGKKRIMSSVDDELNKMTADHFVCLIGAKVT